MYILVLGDIYIHIELVILLPEVKNDLVRGIRHQRHETLQVVEAKQTCNSISMSGEKNQFRIYCEIAPGHVVVVHEGG